MSRAPRQQRRDISESDIADAFVKQYHDRFRFDHTTGKWHEFTGSRWKRNGTKLAFHHVARLAVEMGDGSPKFGRAATANGVEALARADPALAVEQEAWDADPWLLATPGGTVELKTGRLRPARPADMISKEAGVTPEAGDPVRWLRFLAESTGGDHATMRYLQRMAGCLLTGSTKEQALFFLHGPGGNGKSVFLNMLNHIMGEYAGTSGMDAFTASRHDRHPTDLAAMRGARMISASETEEGRQWAEARIKQITGGEKITARFMRQDFFEYTPQFKLLIVGNHAPMLSNVDEAIRRRFNLIPFTQTPVERDPDLEEKLKAGAGQILQWAIEGCLEWQRTGLARPEAVAAATEEYFQDQDVFGQWIRERCDTGPGLWERPATLYHDWATFAREAGVDPGTQVAMGDRLIKAGFRRKRTRSFRAYAGLAIRAMSG